ncbi:MAG: metallophosphoesterase, partial [Clostridia bacterium]|nr:metallophosphoesterase [Clostridia bacterium]
MKKWLSGFLALTMLLSMCVFAPAVSAEAGEDPVVSRFVVVSDVHTNPTSPTNTINRLPKVFSTAYAYAESQGGTVDAFVFNGDVIDGNQTSKGYTNEQEFELFFQGVKDNIKSESKALFAMARTHDIYDGDGNIYYVTESELNSIIADKLGTDGNIIPTADWGYGPHLTKVNGIPVITLTNDIGNGNVVNAEDDGNTNNDDNADNSYHDSEAWLNTTLASLVAENPAQPIFVVFHYPEVGKLGWTQRWGQNSLRDTLNKYPQAIAVNAHVHWDPRNIDSITQDLFTEVYDGAIRDTGGPDATTVAGGSSPIVSYSMVEVTQSGAVTIKYIDPDTGNLLKEANG